MATAKRKIVINRKPKAEAPKKEVKKVVKPIEKKEPDFGQIVGSGSKTTVVAPRGRIRFEAQQASVPMFMLPDDIRRYLTNKGWGSNVWKRSKEWLERHHADMEMIEKLKAFLSGRL